MNDSEMPAPRVAASIAAMPAGNDFRPMPSPAITAILYEVDIVFYGVLKVLL